MPKLTGPFDLFPNLDELSVANISRSISHKLDIRSLKTYIGNRILYPQTIATTKEEIELDLAILKEALTKNPEVIFNAAKKKLTIPRIWLNRLPPVDRLITAIIQSLDVPKGKISMYVYEGQDTTAAGTVYKPDNIPLDSPDVLIEFDDQKNKLNTDTIVYFPIKGKKYSFSSNIFESVELDGGLLGVVFDLRRRS